MEELKQYILSVILTAFICGILSSITPGGKSWVNLICGLVLTIVILKPFPGIQDIDFQLIGQDLLLEGEQISDDGRKIAQNAMVDIITQNTQAYIMDKATELGIHVQAKITVSDDTIPIPVFVTLYGDGSPYLKLQLDALIQRDLGIKKENIRWMQ